MSDNLIVAYVLHRSNDNPDELLFDEIWTDKEALEQHLKKPYIEALDSNIEHLLANEIQLKEYSEIMISDCNGIINSFFIRCKQSHLDCVKLSLYFEMLPNLNLLILMTRYYLNSC